MVMTILSLPTFAADPHTHNSMNLTFKSFFRAQKTFAVFFVLLMLISPVRAKAAGDIVVTIKPLYSLVAQLTNGIKKPVLLIKQMPSAHHYNMRPSDRRLLANAGMIVWIGPQMESYLDKVIRQQDAVIVTAMQADGLNLLERRIKNDAQHDAHEHHGHLDPHIWLSAHNAMAISKHIAEQLISNDPANADKYQENLQRLNSRIDQLAKQIKAGLKEKSQPFLSYHDAFQYFEQENGLHYVDAIIFDEEAGASLKHLHHIKAEIKNKQIQCLLYQPPEPALIHTLTANTKIKAVALDPLGLRVNDNENAWFEIMRGLADGFKHCLSRGRII